MYGLFAWIAGRGEWTFAGLGDPPTNAITLVFDWLYSSDLGIDLLSLVAVLSCIAYLLAGPLSQSLPPNVARAWYRHAVIGGVAVFAASLLAIVVVRL